MSVASPSISVIIPNYNQGHFIGYALEGILNQTLLPQEIIIIDDGSTDNSVEVIETLLKKSDRLKLVKKTKNEGVIDAINDGLAFAKHEYVYFAAADDYTFPNFLEKTAALLEKNPKAGLCSTLSRIIDKEGNDKGLLKTRKIIQSPGYIDHALCERYFISYGNWIQSNTTLYRRESLNQAGKFIPQLKSYADSFVNFRIALSQGVCFIPEALCAWRRLETGFSASHSNNPLVFWQIIEDTEKSMQLDKDTIFHDNFIRNWKKRMLMQFINNQHEATLEKIRFFSDLSKGNFLVKICLGLHQLYYMMMRVFSKLIL